MKFSLLRRPGIAAGIVIMHLFLAAAAYFIILPALGADSHGLMLAGILFAVGVVASLAAAAIVAYSAGSAFPFEDMADSVRLPTLILDGDDRQVLINTTAARILGVDALSERGKRANPALLSAVRNANGVDSVFNADAVFPMNGAHYQAVSYDFRLKAGMDRQYRLVVLRDVTSQLNVREIVRDLNQTMTALNDNTRIIGSSTVSLSRGATQQAQSLASITSTMDEFAKKIQGNTESAEKSTRLAAQAREAAERSGKEITHALSAMTDVQDAGIRIARIVKLIDDIAFQTNLLALNAAVEAARAGRQGKGFAVVADEVRNLAGRSAKAAKDTAGMVEDVTERIGNASAYISKLEEMLSNIVQDAVRMADSSAAASTQSAEQASGILHVNHELGQVSNVTDNTMAAAEETTSSVDALSGQVEGLRAKVAELMKQLFPAGAETPSLDWRREAEPPAAPEARDIASIPFRNNYLVRDDFPAEVLPNAGKTGAAEHSDTIAGHRFESPFTTNETSSTWDLRAEMNNDDPDSLSKLLDSDGYGKEYKELLESTVHSGGRGKNGQNMADLFPEEKTADGDRLVRPSQNIQLDDSEFGRY